MKCAFIVERNLFSDPNTILSLLIPIYTPNPNLEPEHNSVRLVNLSKFGLENGDIALWFKELSDCRGVPLGNKKYSPIR